MIWDYGVLTKRKHQGEGKAPTYTLSIHGFLLLAKSKDEAEKSWKSNACHQCVDLESNFHTSTDINLEPGLY